MIILSKLYQICLKKKFAVLVKFAVPYIYLYTSCDQKASSILCSLLRAFIYLLLHAVVFKAALRKYLNKHSFCFVDEFLCVEMSCNIVL